MTHFRLLHPVDICIRRPPTYQVSQKISKRNPLYVSSSVSSNYGSPSQESEC